MPDLNPATEMEDRIDPWAPLPMIEKAAQDQLARTRTKVDRYTVEPKHSSSMP